MASARSVLFVAVVVLVLASHASGCKLIWDQSHGLKAGVNDSTVYQDFLALFPTYGITYQITTTTLDQLDFDGAGILWVEAQHMIDPGTHYGYEEGDAVFKFVANGGRLLLVLDSATGVEQTYLELLTPLLMTSSPDGTLVAVSDPVATNGSAPTNISRGVSHLKASTEGAGLAYLKNFVQAPVVDSLGRPLVLTADIYPRGRVVVLWDVVLDADFSLPGVDNGQLARNILEYLTEGCVDETGCNGVCTAGQSRCFADYCLCDSGFAGDTCNLALDPCEFTGGCPASPMQCTEKNPVRCPSGACLYNSWKCPIDLLWCEYPDIYFCATSGLCENKTVCVENAKPSCSGVVCANGRCVSNITECNIYPYICLNMYRCPDGTCAYGDISTCRVPPTCGPGERLCFDGFCRPECPLYDGCDVGEYQCRDYTCVANETMCNTCLRPDNTSQEVCWDGACEKCFTPPSYLKPPPLRFRITPDRFWRIPIYGFFPLTVSPSANTPLLLVTVEENTFASTVTLIVNPVGLGNLAKEVGEFTTTALASIIDLKVEPPQTFLKPVGLFFVLNSLYATDNSSLGVSLVYQNTQIQDWDVLSSFSIQTTSTRFEGAADALANGQASQTGGDTTAHFSTFTVLIGGDSQSSDSSDDTDKLVAIILPSVLVPLALMVIVVGGVAVFVVAKVTVWNRGHRIDRLATVVAQASTETVPEA